MRKINLWDCINPDFVVNKILGYFVKNKINDWYEYKDGYIIQHPNKTYTVKPEEISRWFIEHEMLFDLVHVELEDGTGSVLCDYNGDLTAILKQKAGRKYVEAAS